MEKEGLSRGTEFSSFNINTYINNDRHNQITKFVNRKHPSIEYHYVWHVSKGMNTDSVFQSYIIATYIRIIEE